MKPAAKPIRSTIAWGLMGALFYIPLSTALGLFGLWPLNFHLSLCLLGAAYAVLLAHWAQKPLRSIGFPLMLLFLAAISVQSTAAFLFTALLMLSWIRSGICLTQKPLLKRLGAEIILGAGSAFLLFGALPAITIVWALGVWMFFLVQALYFVLLDDNLDRQNKFEIDPFEKARMAAEKILDYAEKEIIIG